MASVVLKIGTKPQSFKPGTVGGKFVFDVKKADGSQVDLRETTETSIVIDLPIGKYTVKAVRLSGSSGDVLGDAVFASFEVVEITPVIIEVCDSVTASQL